MKKHVILSIWMTFGHFFSDITAAEHGEHTIEIKYITADIRWNKRVTRNGDFRKLPERVEINKIRYYREEARFLYSNADVGPGWNSFRLIPFLPKDSDLLIKTRKEALLRLGLPMLEIKKDNYFEWRYISVDVDGLPSVLYVAMTFDEKTVVKEMRVGKGMFPKIQEVSHEIEADGVTPH